MAVLSSGQLPRAVLFDWDNTLVENWLSIQAALNAALGDAGKAPFDLEQTRFSARHSGREVFPRLFGSDWERARDIFYAHFAAHHLAGLRIMPGAEELLAALGEAGVPLAVVSNKKGDLLRREVAHLGWAGRFFGVVGAQDASADKPDPAPVHLVLKDAGIEAGPAVWVVGDTDIDMRAGLAAGCSAILVGPGPDDPDLLAGAEPSLRFQGCESLAGFVRAVGSTISQES
jgi:phosphoglycolate phosphatase